MKKLILRLTFIAIISILMIANENCQAQNENWVPFGFHVQNNNYDGLAFKFESAVRTEIEDDSACAYLWFRVDKKDKSMGFFDNMSGKPIRTKEWKTFKIEGLIDKDAQNLVFGGMCNYNGSFYFDKMKLSIKNKNGKWETIKESGFENGFDAWINEEINQNFTHEIVMEKPFEGKNSLKITGKNIPIYGINTKVGKFATVNNTKIYYEIYGQGKPLMVLNDLALSIEGFSSLFPLLIDKYKVIAINTRDSHTYPSVFDGLTFNILASDVNELMNQLKIDSAYIIGLGAGANTALFLAMEYPLKVQKVIAYNPNMLSDTTAIHPKIIHFAENQFKSSNDLLYKNIYGFYLKNPNLAFGELKKIKAEVLVLSSDRGEILLNHTYEIFKSVSNSQLCIMPGSDQIYVPANKELIKLVIDNFLEKPFEMPNAINKY